MTRLGDRGVNTDRNDHRTAPQQDGASSVAWRDLSTKSDRDAAVPPTGQATAVREPTVTGRIRSHSGASLTIETDALTATLVGVPTVSIADLVYSHHRDAVATSGAVRHCAMFDVENTSDNRLHWLSRRTVFIGTDGYTYDRAHIALNSAELAPGCHTNHVAIEPRCSARVITPVEQLPEGVDVAKVVHTVALNGAAPNQRLTYTL